MTARVEGTAGSRTLAELGEFPVIASLTERFGSGQRVLLGPGDDAAVVRVDDSTAVVATADFFTPVVDDAYDWGRIAATNALSDVYAMGGRPVVAVNLVGWPMDKLPKSVLTEVLRGGYDIAREAACFVAGGHSIDDPEPKYGMAVTGLVHPARLLRNDAAVAGLPITLTKPLGVGVLNNRHKSTGEVFAHAVASMASLNRDACAGALAAGAKAATDVTGFGLLGHLHKMMRASGTTAVVDAAAVPYLDGARVAVERCHARNSVREDLAGRLVPVVEHTDAERLGQRERQPGAGGVVAQQPGGVHDPGDGHAVLGLGVVDAVAAGDVAATRACDVQPAA